MSRQLAGTLLLLLLVPLLVTWPTVLRPLTQVPMAPEYEGATHAWGLWAAMVEGAPVVLHTRMLGWPDGVTVVLVDPANLPAFALGHAIGGTGGALNALTWAGIALAGLGGALLARELDGDPRVGALAAMLSAPILCAGADGITEDLGVGWVAVQLALLLRALRTGRLRHGALAAGALAAAWYAGPYNGLMASAIDAALGVGLVLRGDRRALHALTIAAGAALLVAPLAQAVLSLRDVTLPGGAARIGLPALDHGPDRFRGGLMGAADLLDPWLPAPLTGGIPPVPHSAYLGVVALSAAGLAVYRRPRRWTWLVGIVGLIAAACGPHLYLQGEPLRVEAGPLLGPVGLLIALVPAVGRLTRWYRAASAAALLLAGLVAAAPRTRRGKLLLGAALLLDAVLLAPVSWPHPAATLPDPSPWQALRAANDQPPDPRAPDQQPGAILALPLRTAGTPGPGRWRDVGLLEQMVHRHPIGGTLLGAPLPPAAVRGRHVVQRLLRSGALPARDHQALLDEGFRWLLLRTAYLRLDAASIRRVDACLGPPRILTDELRIYALFGVNGGCPAASMEAPERPPR